MKIAELSYDDFHNCALTAFAVYNDSLRSISSVTEQNLIDDACLNFSTMSVHNSQIISIFFESRNNTVPVMQDEYGRKFVQPLDERGERHNIYFLNPSIAFGI